jgi:hypothetical protein
VVKGRIEFLLFGPTVADPNAHRDDRSLQEGLPA